MMERYRERRWDGEAMSTIACAVGMGKQRPMMMPKKRLSYSDLIPLNFDVCSLNLRSLDETCSYI